MLHHKIHICTSWMGAPEWKSNVQSILFQTNLLNTQNGEKWPLKHQGSLNRAAYGFYHSVYILIRSLKNRCEPSKSVSSCNLPLEVLIRTPVTRVIVVSRGPLPHSWAAHFMRGSACWNECTVWDLCLSPLVSAQKTSEPQILLLLTESQYTQMCLAERLQEHVADETYEMS